MNTKELKEIMPLTTKIQKLLKNGKSYQAIDLHNRAVKNAFKGAQDGKIINLSDLMASKEEITLNN